MAFQISPGIEIKERDLTTIVPAVATTAGGFCGAFVWGPINERVLISSEKVLATIFGNPAGDNDYTGTGIANGAVDFLTATAFLEYGNNLTVVRVTNGVTSATNATASGNSTAKINNEDVWESGFGNAGFSTDYGIFMAKYPGALGNSISVSMCDALGGTSSTPAGATFGARVFRVVCDQVATGPTSALPSPNAAAYVTHSGGSTFGIGQTVGIAHANTNFKLLSSYEDVGGEFTFYLQAGQSDFVNQLTVGSTAAGLYVNFGSVGFRVKRDSSSNFEVYASASTDINIGTAYEVWEWQSSFESIPGTSNYASNVGGSYDEMHIVVYDSDGLWTGTPGTVLERFPFVSKARDAKTSDGTNNYWVEVLREKSAYLWAADVTVSTDRTGAGEEFNLNASNRTFGSFGVRDFNLRSGSNGSLPRAADYVTGYNTYYADPEIVDVQLLIGNGASTETNSKTIADALISLCDTRKDCIAFLSPAYNDVSGSTPRKDIVEYRNTLTSTSYAVLDTGGWKKRFDAYNDVDRWIPTTGDVAGLCVRTDRLADPWFSPAGLNRGQIRNAIKLAYNPDKTDRDVLYANGINPIVTFPGEGTVLFGDKTLLSRPSAFDRINVRRLFIVLEKAISTASKYILFEQNDAFTRSQFKNLVEPFLRDVQGRRGITDFRVVCDETNNTAQVIDSNNFVADIYIKPTRSINFITLNFIATPTGLSFSEVTG